MFTEILERCFRNPARKLPWMYQNPGNNGINYQPQLVQDVFHQQYGDLLLVFGCFSLVMFYGCYHGKSSLFTIVCGICVPFSNVNPSYSFLASNHLNAANVRYELLIPNHSESQVLPYTQRVPWSLVWYVTH